MDDIRCLMFISEASVACHANKAQAVNIVHFLGLDKSWIRWHLCPCSASTTQKQRVEGQVEKLFLGCRS